MRANVGEFSSEYAVKSSGAKLGTKNAWALYARRRWPQNGVKLAMAEWSLTEGEAKGLFAAQISQPTIDKIIDHKRGGFGLGLLILEIRCQTGLREWIQSERERSADAAKRAAEDAAALGQMARDLPAAAGLGGAGGDRMGDRRNGERRSFRR
jgi:hypothetical protein